MLANVREAPRDPGRMGQSFCVESTAANDVGVPGRSPSLVAQAWALLPQMCAWPPASRPHQSHNDLPRGGTRECLSVRSRGFFLGLHEAPMRQAL